MSKSKILIITSEFPPGPGGIGQHAASLAIGLSRYYGVMVLCNQDYCDEEEKLNYTNTLPPNIRVFNFIQRRQLLTSFRRILQTKRIIQKYQPDQIVATGRFPLWIAGFVKCLFPKFQVQGFAHGSEVTNHNRLQTKLTYWACERLDTIYAVSQFTARMLSSNGLRNIKILPNGIDDSLLKIEDVKIKPFSNWKGRPSLLTVGNVTYRKGQHRVIKALPYLLQKFPDLHYHIVGLPTEEDEFKQLAKRLGVADAVTFHGRLASKDELYQAYKSSDLFIMLSENQLDGDVEGFGIAILEANAFGVPAIGALGCGIEDAIGPESGILVDGNNVEAILYAIEEIQKDYNRYRIRAREWAEKHNWNRLIIHFMED